MKRLQFFEAEHLYKLDGARVPNVTTVCGVLAPASGYFRDADRTRGSFVHLACSLDDDDVLNYGTVDAAHQGYLSAWRGFRNDCVKEILQNEERVFSNIYRFAGTLDRIIITKKDGTWLVDIKTGDPTEAAGPQTAAYELCAREMGLLTDPCKRAVVRLEPDGSFKVHHYDHVNDIDAFLAALTIYNWRSSR